MLYPCLIASLLALAPPGAPAAEAPAVAEAVGAPAASAALDDATARWDRLLKQVVRDELVDYLAVRDRYRQDLRACLDAMAAVDVSALDRQQKLALFCNAYNAWMIELVVERYRPDYSPQEAKGAIWDEAKVRLAGQTLSLNTLEHQWIRKDLDDPRAHAALVCAARSCPALPDEAFAAERLDQQFDAAMRRWLNDPRRNVVDHEARELRLSKIFRWYAADFGGPDRLAEYVSRYVDRDVSGYAVSFLQYDWRLNDTSGKGFGRGEQP